eukprot:4664927-Pyramimonas_sp.AAC.1
MSKGTCQGTRHGTHRERVKGRAAGCATGQVRLPHNVFRSRALASKLAACLVRTATIPGNTETL